MSYLFNNSIKYDRNAVEAVSPFSNGDKVSTMMSWEEIS